MRCLATPSGQTLWYVGPDLSEGAIASVFYFSLSAKESLLTDPFNQMVVKLQNSPIRIFSIDLPYHGEDLPATDAMKGWAEEISQGKDPLTPFFQKTADSLQFLRDEGLISLDKTAIVGLSRGALVALKVAAKLSWLPMILGFAPLTQIKYAKEFSSITHNDIVTSLNPNHQLLDLIHKKIRFYISNRDMRVSTKECFTFISSLANLAYEHGVKAPQIELLIKPPLGAQGHGTSKEIFEEGALWILKEWGLS
ncbi:MAG: hypothetical protein NTX49_03980 [Chlamydiae bacterium]|nr:hypothetical protein [Chlamydiota bacterium]